MSKTTTERRQRKSDNVIEMRETTVFFEMERGRSKVVNSVDADIERGQIFGVVGESGSGKSMFAASLMDAVVEPGITTGEITYYPKDGPAVDVLNLEKDDLKRLRWEEISMVFQGAQSSFNPTLSIRGHFEETLNAHNYPFESGMTHARELLSNLYMDPERVLDSYPHELSGGMKQRSLIALSLVLRPEVLVLDEPTASLDLLMQQSILSLLEELKDEYDLTMIFITHDIPLVTELADEIGIMYAFEFVEFGPTSDILSDPAHPYTRLLLKSTPNVSVPIDDMRPIEGNSPDPVNIPSGCTFHPRCPLADNKCRMDDPLLLDAGPDHRAACFYWDESSDAIPTTWMEGDR